MSWAATMVLAVLMVLAQVGPAYGSSPFAKEEGFNAGHVLRHHGNRSYITPSVSDGRVNLPSARLAWLTPWNNNGFDRAADAPTAFNLLAPCWFEVSQKKGRSQDAGPNFPVSVQATGYINTSWARTIQERNPDAKIVPRVNIGWQGWGEQGRRLFSDAAVSEHVAKVIADGVTGLKPGSTERKYANLVHGVAVEWGHASLNGKGMREGVSRFLVNLRQQLAEAAELDDVTLVLVVPPSAKAVGSKQIAWLSKVVDFFAVMTYDYNAGSTSPMENAPMEWVQKVMKDLAGTHGDDVRRKLLVGLNMYGFRFSAQPKPPVAMTGTDFVKVLGAVRSRARAYNKSISRSELAKKPAITWAVVAKEHSFEHHIPKKGVEWVFFPSLASLAHRIDYAAENGFGISAWELGQGLEYFTHLFVRRGAR